MKRELRTEAKLGPEEGSRSKAAGRVVAKGLKWGGEAKGRASAASIRS